MNAVATGTVLAALALVTAAVFATEQGSATDADVIEVPGATIGRMGVPAEVNPEEFDFSEAETRLWLSDHLKNITRPARLHYEFQRAGSYEEGFIDAVFLDIIGINQDGSKNAELRFFTGPREQPVNADNITEITGNPVLGTYMGGDVRDMNRLTSGSWRYFQRRIKLALSEGAVIEQISVTFEGRSVAAQRISITPYLKDPRRAEFERFAGKRYEFILSDEIPGTLFQIHTLIPGDDGAGEPLIEETLTLRQVEFRS